MTPERWERITRLCEAALERDPQDRDAFLRQLTGDDEELRPEVESLLRFDSGHAVLGPSERATPVPSFDEYSSAAGAPRPDPFRAILAGLSVLPLTGMLVAGPAIWQHGARQPSLDVTISMGRPIVTAVADRSPAQGALRPGDRILALDGDHRVAVLGTYWKLRDLEPDRSYVIDFERDGTRHRTPVRYSLNDSGSRLTLFCRMMVGLIWAAVGIAIGMVRPRLLTARLVALACVTMGTVLIRASTYSIVPLMGPATAGFYGVLLLATAPAMALSYHAVYRFPPGVSSTRFWSAALGVTYVAAALHLVYSLLIGARYFSGPDVALALEQALNPKGILSPLLAGALSAVCLGLTIAVAARNYRVVTDREQRRRVKWIVLAIGVSAGTELAHAVLMTGPADAMGAVADLSTIAVPLAFTHGILRHRVFDIAVAVRRGMRYLLAVNALRLMIASPAVALMVLIFRNPDLTIRNLLVGHPVYPLVIVGALIALTVRRRLIRAIDRRFFREAVDREQLLRQILDDIDLLDTGRPAMAQIARRLQAALHPSALSIWFSDGNRCRFRLAYPDAGVRAVPSSLSLPPAVVQRLEADDSTVHELGAEYVIPMISGDGRLRGALMLGHKRSEEPYTAADLWLLRRVARQLAAGRERGELHVRMREQARVRALLKECPVCGACYDIDHGVCGADGTALSFSLPVERTIAGRYRLDRRIGRGGMGAVYEAFDERLHRQVAVKVMAARHFGNPDALRRFDREARAAARLHHPNIVSVFDYGRLDDLAAFLVMERVHGQTLRAVLSELTRHPSDAAVGWIEQLLEAVAAAHSAGVIHRDLKPENVLVTSRTGAPDEIKVLDFGLAALRAVEGEESVSATGSLMGTLAYMAPEQMLGREADERADLFSAGVMIYEILTGARPFSANPVLRLTEIARGLPLNDLDGSQLRAAVARCVDEDPARRYVGVVEAQRELRRLIPRFVEQHQAV